MCTPFLIPKKKKKKNTFNGSLPPFHGGETNQVWSVEADATEQIVNDFCRRGGGGKIKRARSSGQWYLNGPWLRIRAYETRFGFREIYTSPPIVSTLLPSATKIKASLRARRKFQLFFPPPSFFIFVFRFCFSFSRSSFLPFFPHSNICLEDSLDPRTKSWNNSDYRLMRGSNHFDFESIPDLF